MKIAYYAFVAVGLQLCLCGTAQSVDLIVNPDISQETVSRSTVRSIFSMRMTRWPDGTPIHVFVMGDRTDLHAAFSKQILGVFPHQLRRAWSRQIYSGMGQAPTKVESEEEMREQIEKTPGAIGYLSKENTNERVRTISVE
ncbi:MAG: substrate-binding domain-containing protein [Candidatus Thiodiazotropha sp. (ex Epidulcina cf. delphinae)]|nr:substrate-binding domain-containing protein [Candidatus Thiodiazotropha sp. (ex Epidulcina cf. delphinae)]